ncbi:MAG: hypothetical protein WDO18_07545 [Acidobacteriota bacterium]
MGDHFYLVGTSNNTVAATDIGINGHTVVDVAFSTDSRYMYMLRTRLFQYSLAIVDLTTMLVSTPVDIPYAGSALALSPLGRLYVSGSDAIGEYNAQTLELVANIPVTGRPGTLRFTPDGTRAYFPNLTPEFGGRSLQSFRTAVRDVTGWPGSSASAPRFEDVLVASADLVYALDRTSGNLWKITTNPLTGVAANFPGVLDSNQVYAAAISDEQPVAANLFVVGSYNGQLAIKRIKLSDGTQEAQTFVPNSDGVLSYVSIARQVGASFLTKLGDNQTVPITGGTVRLAVRLTDSASRPVFNHPVLFATANSGVTLSNSTANTGTDGVTETYVSVPGQPGVYMVSVIAASISDTFTITVTNAEPNEPEPGTGQAHMRIVRGDGLLLRQNVTSPTWSPLTVQVLNESNDPVPAVQVDYSVISGSGGLFPETTLTDENGLIRASFYPGVLPFGVAYDTSIVRAHSIYGDLDFKIIVFSVNSSTGIAAVQVDTPSIFQATVTRGDTYPAIYSARISTRNTAQGIPGVTLRVASGSDYTQDGPATCVNDTHSNANGVAVCDMKISCSAADLAPLQMMVGEFVVSSGALVVRPAAGRQLALVSGNNQTGSGGAVLNSLVAKVTDNCGAAVAGQDVVWTVSTGSATLTQVVNRSGSDGTVSAGVTLGNIAGPVTVRLSLANSSPIDFTLTNNAVINSVVVVSGDGQAAAISTPFANPLIFEVRDNNGAAIGAGVPVAFSITGPATLGSTQSTTDAQGRAQTTVTATNQPGQVVVTATAATKTATATLSVRPMTLPIDASSFTNAASGISGLVPCGLITLRGDGLDPQPNTLFSGLSSFGPLPYTLADVTIRINGIPAPLQVVANQNGVQSVNFQAPCELQPGLASAVVTVKGTDTPISNIPVYVAQPGIFTYAGPDNKTYGAVIRLRDGSYITPANPAVTGEDYILVLTGLGQTIPPTTTNASGLEQALALQTVVGVNNGGVLRRRLAI